MYMPQAQAQAPNPTAHTDIHHLPPSCPPSAPRLDGKGSWYIDYTNAEPFMGRGLNEFVDEIREVAPGMLLGKVRGRVEQDDSGWSLP